MRKTLLRRLTYKLGIDSFPGRHDAEVRQIDIDGQAMDNYFDLINKSRISKTVSYYSSEESMQQLAVFCILLDAVDSSLLYPLLGDTLKDPAVYGKMDLLLDREVSAVGLCFFELRLLLEHWLEGGASRKPWCILDVLQAPCRDPKFMRWVRSQILRMNSSLFRRYESRLAAWPYPLYALTSSHYSVEERTSVVRRLRAASGDMLDTYSRGLRVLYSSEEALLSHACRQPHEWTLFANALLVHASDRLKQGGLGTSY
jgi:hypothetical protein